MEITQQPNQSESYLDKPLRRIHCSLLNVYRADQGSYAPTVLQLFGRLFPADEAIHGLGKHGTDRRSNPAFPKRCRRYHCNYQEHPANDIFHPNNHSTGHHQNLLLATL